MLVENRKNLITPAFFVARQRKINFEITNNRVFPRDNFDVSKNEDVNNIAEKDGSNDTRVALPSVSSDVGM